MPSDNDQGMPRLGRVIGEVGIIVVGVLLALGGEGLISRIGEQSDLESYRAGLLADLQRDSVELARLLDPGFLPTQATAVDSLLVFISDPEANPPGEAVLRHLIGAAYIPSAEKTRATFDEMVSAGQLDLLELGELRRGLVAYYSRPLVPSLDAYSVSYHAPYFLELGRAVGIARYHAMLGCAESEGDRSACLRTLVRGDELDAVRNSELGALLVGLQLLRYYATRPAQAARDEVNELLVALDKAPAS